MFAFGYGDGRRCPDRIWPATCPEKKSLISDMTRAVLMKYRPLRFMPLPL